VRAVLDADLRVPARARPALDPALSRALSAAPPPWYDAFVQPANVILVGFMGAGKSACGRLLARRLGRCFVETDEMIVAREGRSIPEIFREDGEVRFRQLEDETLGLLRLKSGDVIATGGGFPCRPGRMEALKEVGTVVWLAGDLAECHERARRSGDRPMLAGRSAADVEALYREREPYYRAAHLTVDTTGLGVDQVVARVLRALRPADAARV
jgi:shikimate kinase